MHDAFSFDVDITAFLEDKAVAESLVNRLRRLNAPDSRAGHGQRAGVALAAIGR